MLKLTTSKLNSLLIRSAFSKVETKVENKIGILYLDSQKDFNALSVEMKSNIVKNINEFESSKDVKVIVILSKVKKAFCAGANIKEFENKRTDDF